MLSVVLLFRFFVKEVFIVSRVCSYIIHAFVFNSFVPWKVKHIYKRMARTCPRIRARWTASGTVFCLTMPVRNLKTHFICCFFWAGWRAQTYSFLRISTPKWGVLWEIKCTESERIDGQAFRAFFFFFFGEDYKKDLGLQLRFRFVF